MDLPLGTKVNIVAEGTKNAKATLSVLANDLPFKIIKDGEAVTEFEVIFDENGQSTTEVALRPKDDMEYNTLIDDF